MLRIIVVSIFLFFHMSAQAAVVEYDLTIDHQPINITGKSVYGMTINGDIPGPTLRFNEGDSARIKVHNKMNVDTSIHWHGILVPPDMDAFLTSVFRPLLRVRHLSMSSPSARVEPIGIILIPTCRNKAVSSEQL